MCNNIVHEHQFLRYFLDVLNILLKLHLGQMECDLSCKNVVLYIFLDGTLRKKKLL